MNETPNTNPTNEDQAFSNAARRIVVDEKAAPERPLHITERGKKVRAGAIGATGALAVAAIALGVNNMDTGATEPKLETPDGAISLSEGARLRSEPTVFDEERGSNRIDTLETSVVIEPSAPVEVKRGTDNGTWYGLQAEDLATAIPGFDKSGDSDNIIWVNEQKAHITDTTPTQRFEQ